MILWTIFIATTVIYQLKLLNLLKLGQEGGKEQHLRLSCHIMEGHLMGGKSSLVCTLFKGKLWDSNDAQLFGCMGFFIQEEYLL